jgi:GAF domain-containing protein
MNKRAFLNNKLTAEQARARQLILIISLIGFIATTILTITSIAAKNLTETIIDGSTAVLLAISLILSWFGSVNFGRFALPLTALISITYLAIIGDGIYDPGNLAFAIVIAIAALLLGARGLIIYGTLSVGALLGIVYVGTLGIFQHKVASIPDIIAALMGLIVSTIILYLNARQREQSLSETRHSEQVQIQINQELLETKASLEEQTQQLAQANQINMHRVEQLRLVAEVANSAASVQELEQLLPTISELISQRFGVFHTGIFLLDDSREFAILRAASSESGQKLLMRGHRLQVGSQGIVSFVAATGNPRIALDLEMKSSGYSDSDLPETRSEIALPLKIIGETIGVLDLQSTEPNEFSQEDIEILSILADQVAIAIQNARSFESSRSAVQDAKYAYEQLTGKTWSQFMHNMLVAGYHFDGVETKPMIDHKNETSCNENGTVLQIPVRLRGREIGKLKLTALGSERTWNEDEIAIAESAAERAALSLENARLLEDAQRLATREQIIGEISASVSSSADMEEILRSAVQELGRKMGGAEVVLELGTAMNSNEN